MHQHHGAHLFAMQQRQDLQQLAQHSRQHQYTDNMNSSLTASSHNYSPSSLQLNRPNQQHHELPLLLVGGLGNNGHLRKGRWSPSEDDRLRSSIRRHGANKWKQVAKEVMSRSGDQCWKRWNDSLDPHLNHSQWTSAEDAILEAAVLRSGRLWSKIATDNLPGRSGLSCKNRWDHIQRKQRRLHQSQRDILQNHGSSRNLLDSGFFIGQRNSSSIIKSSTFFDANHNTNRLLPLGDGFQRHSIGSIPLHHPTRHNQEDEGRNVMPPSSSSSSLLHKNEYYRPDSHRSFAPILSSSWGGSAAGHGSHGAAPGNNTLSPYLDHNTSFPSPPMTDSRTLPTSHKYSSSSPYPTSGGMTEYTTPASTSLTSNSHNMTHQSRSFPSWFSSNATNHSQIRSATSTKLDSSTYTDETNECTGGMLTYTHEEKSASKPQEDQHQHQAQQHNSHHSTNGFLHSFAPAHDYSSSWPTRSAAPTPVSSLHRSHLLWTPRSHSGLSSTESTNRSYAAPLPVFGRSALEEVRMSDDFKAPRTQPSVPGTASTNTSSRLDDYERFPMSRDTFDVHPSHPFAFSPGRTSIEERHNSFRESPLRLESRGATSCESDDQCEGTSGVNERTETGSYSMNSAAHRNESNTHTRHFSPLRSPYRTKRVTKVEDMTNSLFCDELEYRCYPRRHHQQDYHDEDVTSDEEEGQLDDPVQDSYDKPLHDASLRSQTRRSSFALL